jgi:hypothetical protein
LRLSISERRGVAETDGLNDISTLKNTAGIKTMAMATASGPLKKTKASKSGHQANSRATGLISRV